MSDLQRKAAEQHIKTHSVPSDMDRAAVNVLEIFLRSDGRINTNFAAGDKWPNSDGTFEFVENPLISRRPNQNFFVQIKGTHRYTEKDGIVNYSLRSLAFPAFVLCGVTYDPGILFVVLNPDCRGAERVFWKYMSVNFVHSIDFEQDSATISFSPDEEIKNTDESIDNFCAKLVEIIDHHSFVNQMKTMDYSKKDIKNIIRVCNEYITESIDRMDIYNDTRDGISQRILTKLEDLCVATLVLNALSSGLEKVSLRLAWDRALLSIETKYLATFFRALSYVGYRVPDEGQSERLMLKYYDFLWQIREFLKDKFNISVLHNLEKFPLHLDMLDQQYYQLVADAICSISDKSNPLRLCRFYVQKKTPFFVGKERYYEVTLQLANVYATKYNRLTAYTKTNISTNYSVQIGYTDAIIDLWGIDSKIKVITNWKVSIEPICLNKLGKILNIPVSLSSRHGEYTELMDFLTQTGISLLDLIDLQKDTFTAHIDKIYEKTNTDAFKQILQNLQQNFSHVSTANGKNVIRYLLLNLREETLESVMPTKYNPASLYKNLYLNKKCLPFERNPFISNLAGSRTTESIAVRNVISITKRSQIKIVRPYLSIKKAIMQTGEIYFEAQAIASDEEIDAFNCHLDDWERRQGYQIMRSAGLVYIDIYQKTTISILQKLQEFSSRGNRGQRAVNEGFVKRNQVILSDDILKEQALRNIFVNSQLLLIYGAAGTGKTTLINHISNLMSGYRKLFLTKTHTALQNLKRRIDNPGTSAEFISIDSFTKSVSVSDYDIIFVDECSTIDNRTMLQFLQKIRPDSFLVLAGDIHQIESIDFGNWFFYAKDIIKPQGANVELLNTWRTKDETLISLWNEVRTRDSLITEKLVIDGPFSEDIGPNVFNKIEDDEVVLCLNYDGKFGLNNMNSYFQNANKSGEAVYWQEWSYKVGDPILFNDTKRFPILYNNLKGRIVNIIRTDESISFVIDVDMLLTEMDCKKEDFDFIDIMDNSTRIQLTVYTYDAATIEEDVEIMRMRTIIPFQLAYAVSIHKAQGLEYDSVKVVIPSGNSERITHNIFYTAITRAKKCLKIYWSSETMKEIVGSFTIDKSKYRSLEIVRNKLLIK
ncbi:MAG: AAA family ATPase [Lachnospiraceae bacterium]|nr:AAA family ATPase [Lachnospiraceae bacterium]